jgi:molybdate transport system ATP-binding protein
MITISFIKRLPQLTVDVEIEIAHIGLTCIFGPSGAGKSTILSMVAGLDSPDAGLISINGRRLYDSKNNITLPPEERKVGMVFQDALLFPHMTVKSNLLYGKKPSTDQRPDSFCFDEVVTLLGVDHLLDRRPRHLSGGERQRVAIGRALLSDPALLLMDEPLASLDPARKEEIIPFIEKVKNQRRLPILYVTHDQAEQRRLADAVVKIEAGSVRYISCRPEQMVLRRDHLGKVWHVAG